MKLIFTLILAVGLSFSGTIQAQNIAHINTSELVEVMPETAEAKKELEDYANQLELRLRTLSNDYQEKASKLEEQVSRGELSPSVQQTKMKEISDLAEQIQNYTTEAQDALNQKEQELIEPINKKAKAAIEKVAKEHGYDYVLDEATLLVMPPSRDILPLVKKELGL